LTGRGPTKPEIVAECCFLDVGQGTCNVILLGSNRAIIIDCGPVGFTPVRCLQHFGVREIVALVVSHNDADHYGGATQLIQSFPKQIRQVYFLEDRPARKTPLMTIIRREHDAGNLSSQPIRLEADSDKGKVIFDDPGASLSLHVLFPWMLANIDARERGGRNKTSAVLALQCGKRRIVFGGDLQYEGWHQLRTALNAAVRCDVLAAPHHGGLLSDSDQSGCHSWVYREAVKCKTGIVSVGSNNRWRHPLATHVRASRESGANVLCTQITPRCCDALERLRPGVVVPTLPGASSPSERFAYGSGRSRHVACAGSILVEIGPESVRIDRLEEHRAAVERLAATQDGHPLCCASTQATEDMN
jgi:beta-lactamase superfamily II metal-dependent hydrolase